MILQEIHDIAACRSYFSRPDSEVWAAINSASRFIYHSILKENQQYFRTLDTTSLTLTPNVQSYDLPATAIQILRIRERVNSTDTWRHIDPIDPNSDEAMADNPSPTVTFPGGSSSFTYQGPFLKQATAIDGNDDEIYTIYINPIPQDTRQVELLYMAKYVEVHVGTDPYMIPKDMRDVALDFASSELLRGNNDDLSEKYYEAGNIKLSMALTLIRDRQLQHLTSVEPYLGEYM